MIFVNRDAPPVSTCRDNCREPLVERARDREPSTAARLILIGEVGHG
jgi:hypothetical protein